MRKSYSGYALPSGTFVTYAIEWSCMACGSGEVDIDPQDTRRLHWCDREPSTEDSLRLWTCLSCGQKTLGRNLPQARTELSSLDDAVRC